MRTKSGGPASRRRPPKLSVWVGDPLRGRHRAIANGRTARDDSILVQRHGDPGRADHGGPPSSHETSNPELWNTALTAENKLRSLSPFWRISPWRHSSRLHESEDRRLLAVAALIHLTVPGRGTWRRKSWRPSRSPPMYPPMSENASPISRNRPGASIVLAPSRTYPSSGTILFPRSSETLRNATSSSQRGALSVWLLCSPPTSRGLEEHSVPANAKPRPCVAAAGHGLVPSVRGRGGGLQSRGLRIRHRVPVVRGEHHLRRKR